MILLDGHSLTAAQAVPVAKMSLQLKEKDGTANITPVSLDGIGMNSWLLDDKAPEAGIVWRVRSIQQAFENRTPTVSLDHIICTLKDRILFGEITPKTITGNPNATTCTARQAVDYILAQQSDWVLGSFDYGSVSNAYKFDGDTLYDALETVTDTLENAVWTYNMGAYPFTLNIVQHSDSVDSEMRAGRNLKTISRTVDISAMYTRFYPIGKDDLHIPGDYVERNVSTYGVISKVETDQSLDTVEELTAWANERLNLHAQPNVTITAEGLELSRETGEALDAFTMGRVCRVPLPEFDTTIQERITEKNYPDKIGQPDVVKITMANSRRDVTKIIADAIKRSGRGSRTAAKKDKDDHAWFEDTNDHVSMTAIGIIGVDAQGNPNWTRLSEFIADGEGLHAKVETQINDATDRIATLEINEEGIRTEVAESASTIYTTINQTASGITQEVVRRARVYVQLQDPALQPGITVREGDIWIKSIRIKTWNEMGSKTWTSATEFNWNQYAGSPQYVWTGTRWEEIGDQGAITEYATRIEQTERNISLIARALGAVDPTAIAEIDISAEAIQSAVSTAKSELYSVIRQTATNITAEVVNDIAGISSYVEETASSMTQAIARKNRVFVQLTDPVYNTGVTVIEGDIWIKSSGNDNVKQTWGQLSAKTWSSQNATNWREYYEGYWYTRKNGSWQLMNANADVVEIGTKLEQDEKHIALIARDVDANHQELGSRLEVTATQIRGEVHAAKSSLYSTIVQTATSIRSEVASTASSLSSSIQQTASSIRSEVNAAKSSLYSSITQTATQIRFEVASAQSSLSSSITQTASQIRSEVASTASGLSSSITQNADKIGLVVTGTGSDAKVNAASIVAGINNQSGSYVKISASTINLNGYVRSTSLTTQWLDALIAEMQSVRMMSASVTGSLRVGSTIYFGSDPSDVSKNLIAAIRDLQLTRSGNTYTLQKKSYNDSDWQDVGTFSRAVSSFIWGGGSGKINVTALPQNQTQPVNVSVDGTRNITSNGTYTYKVYYENLDGDDVETGASMDVTVNVPASATIDAIANYDANGNIITNRTITSALKLIPWAKVNGTWYEGTSVTISPPSYTRYQFGMTRTQDAQGYHYTFKIDTGNTAPFGSGSSYYLYKAN